MDDAGAAEAANAASYAALLDRIYRLHDSSAVDELVAPDYRCDYGGRQLVGRDAFRAAISEHRDALDEATVTILASHAHGDTLWARWQVTAVHKGPILGIAPTWSRIAFGGLSVQRFAGGVMVEGAIHWDRLTLVEALRRASSPGAIYRAMIARVFEGGDLAAIPDFIDPDYIAEEEGGDRRVGHEGARRVAVVFRAAMPNLVYEITDLVEDGHRVFAKWIVTGDHGGPLFGIPATGKRLRIRGMSVNEVRNGRIWRGSIFWDRAALAAQLGQPVTAAMFGAP